LDETDAVLSAIDEFLDGVCPENGMDLGASHPQSAI